jgi:glycosyltransferase involved in cell wall biosynthesis
VRGKTIAVSRYEAEIASEIIGRSRVVTVLNGVVVAPYEAPPRQPFSVVAAGRAIFQRRPDLMAEVAEALRGDGIYFRWIGDGPGREVLERAGVEVTGWVEPSAVRRSLSHAHVVLHLSAFEGLPLALLEAMAIGRPVIASDLPPTREALADTGILVRRPVEAVEAVRHLRRNESLRADLGSRARDRVERLFSRGTMVERMMALYGVETATQCDGTPPTGSTSWPGGTTVTGTTALRTHGEDARYRLVMQPTNTDVLSRSREL